MHASLPFAKTTKGGSTFYPFNVKKTAGKI